MIIMYDVITINKWKVTWHLYKITWHYTKSRDIWTRSSDCTCDIRTRSSDCMCDICTNSRDCTCDICTKSRDCTMFVQIYILLMCIYSYYHISGHYPNTKKKFRKRIYCSNSCYFFIFKLWFWLKTKYKQVIIITKSSFKIQYVFKDL